ncbi:MAG: nicotinamide riboside transporter PnuC [Coxiellaceae bacterium]|nr:nicotinamide riboside transporter PnuC [Coxiellaceae bacterium]
MKHHTFLDPLGSIFSSVSTVFYVLAHWIAWPASLIAIVINGYLYFSTGLFADMTKEIIYLALTLYGWYEWLRGGKDHQPIKISHISWREVGILCVVFAVGCAAVYALLSHFTSSKVPLWDASTTTLSLIAEWMVCRKYIENWILWGVVDAMYIGLYFHKGLPAHGIEMSAYVLIAVIGYWLWRRKMIIAASG